MTAAWVTPQSLSPDPHHVAIHPDRLTHQFVSATEEFVVNIPVMDSLSIVHQAGMISGHDGAVSLPPSDWSRPNRLSSSHRAWPGVPDPSSARVQDRVSAGDHDLFIAEVVAVAADDESFDGHWNVEVDAGRLLHHLGADRYAGLANQFRVAPAEPEKP